MSAQTSNPRSRSEEVERIREPGLTQEEVAQRYSEWAKDAKYDKDLTGDFYEGPTLVAASVAHYMQERKDASILDVGAGTGKVAAKLKELGFENIDALDGSDGMLDVARGKNLYQQYFCAFFTDKVDAIKTNAYDVLVCCGAIGQGHIKCNALGEMIRCVKPGGLIVLILREKALVIVPDLKDNMEPYIKQMEKEGQWTLLERSTFPEYVGDTGIKFVFKVTKA